LDREEVSAGIAIDYLGLHTGKTGIEEVDLVLLYQDGEWTWRAIVAFSSKSNAIEGGRYETDGYDGYEFVPWKADDRFDRMEALIEEDVTPIAYTKGEPTYAAHAMQEADKIHVLNRMFGIGGLKTLTRRRKRLFNRVVPQEVRWKDEDTSLQNLAKQIVGADEDTPDPADEPYEVGDSVEVYFGSNSTDSPYQGTVGTVVDVIQDDLDGEAEVDEYSYKIEADGEEIEAWFRHQNLVASEYL
jgi:hypothetical protein